jgi:hypothetical protein
VLQAGRLRVCPSLHDNLRFLLNAAISNYTVFIVQAYQTSQYVMPSGSIFLGKWRSSIAGISNGKMNVQSAYALNTRYF